MLHACSLLKTLGLTQKICLTNFNTVVTQDIVGSRDMEIEVWNDPSQQVLLTHKLKVPLFNGELDLFGFCAI
jgi:hypothetical protein